MNTEINTYVKFAPHVFVAKTKDKFNKGDIIILTTRRGKENEHIVHNLVNSKDGYNYYSITRVDGYNLQERAKRKAERYEAWAGSRERKSNEYYEASKEGREFLALAEPIKVGHHSEKRHRALIERNHRRMDLSMENRNKAIEHAKKAEYWSSRANEINLSMPESLDLYKVKLQEAENLHKFYLENPDKRRHSYSLTYARNDVKKFEKQLSLAKKLWE